MGGFTRKRHILAVLLLKLTVSAWVDLIGMKELRSISWVIEVENAMEGELAKKVWWLT
jgi:hypothetical protein